MKVSQIRHFINGFTRRFLSDSAEYSSELTTLTALRALAPVDSSDESVLNPGQLLQLRQIFHQRDGRIRTTPLDYTYAPNLPVNLYFISLGSRLADELDEPLVKILMVVTNDVCFNLGSDFRKGKNSLLSACAEYSNPRHPRDYTKRGRGYAKLDLSGNPDKDRFLPPQLHALYFHENTLYSIPGLLAANKMSPNYSSRLPKVPFSTFSSQDNKTRVAVSPESLRNIRQKAESLEIAFNINLIEKTYDSPWSWLREEEIPTWRHKGVFPHATVAYLIEKYLISNSDTDWTSHFKTWSEVLLRNPSIDAVNCLYGQRLDEERDLYFIDVLLDISPTNVTPSLDEHIAVIASWFFRTVPAEQGSSRISALFNNHWDRIKDKPGDYFSAPSGQLSPYERLAKKMSQRGIPGWRNYHQMLVRTLVDDVDPLAESPLSDFILSKDERKLYNLQRIKENQERGRGFCNVHTMPMSFFYEDEKKRISRSADPTFFQRLAQIHTVETAEKPLACSTIKVLRTFANEVIDTYIDDQNRTDQLVEGFHFALDTLSADERARLDGKAILQNGYYLSFSEELEKIQNKPQDVCLYNIITRLIFPIIVDHDPITRFSPSIELIPNINTPEPHTSLLTTLRAASRKNVYRDYDALSSVEALNRLKILMVSAMSAPFHEKTHPIRMSGCTSSHQGPRVCAEIVRHVAPVLGGTGDLRQSRFAYAVIMEHVVKPALLLEEPEPERTPWGWWASGPKMFTTHAWLSSLLTERIFVDDNAWSVPGYLVPSLRLYANAVRSRTDRTSIDGLVNVLERLGREKSLTTSTLINDIESNIVWKQFLHGLPTEERDMLLRVFKPPSPVTSTETSPSSSPPRTSYI